MPILGLRYVFVNFSYNICQFFLHPSQEALPPFSVLFELDKFLSTNRLQIAYFIVIGDRINVSKFGLKNVGFGYATQTGRIARDFRAAHRLARFRERSCLEIAAEEWRGYE